MTATWFLVRHVHDLRRREPRNVGVIVRTGEGEWLARFLGETEAGEVDARRLADAPMSLDAYKSWVEYFRRKLSDERWGDVERLQRRRSRSNYFAEEGGRLIEDDRTSQAELIGRLYTELVAEPESLASSIAEHRQTVARRLTTAAAGILSEAGLAVSKKVDVPAVFGEHRTTVPFLFRHVNGQPHLMDIVQRHARVEDMAADARELSARVVAARAAGSATSFFSFYSAKLLPEDRADQILIPLEEVTHTVDIDDETDAVAKLRGFTGGHQ